jgi:hypothetical protein
VSACQPNSTLVRDTGVLVPETGVESTHDFDALYRRDFANVVALVYGRSGSRWAAARSPCPIWAA